jgi:hypothetical protein
MGTFIPEVHPHPERAPLLGYHLLNRGAQVPEGVSDAWHERLQVAVAAVRSELGLGLMTEWDIPIPDSLRGTLQRRVQILDRLRVYTPDDDLPALTPGDVQEIRADLARRQHRAAEAFRGMHETPLHLGSLVIPPHDQPYPIDRLWVPEPADLALTLPQ